MDQQNTNENNSVPPFLSIDYGEKNIGLAVSDFKGIISTPIETVRFTKRRGAEELIGDIVGIVEEYRVKTIVIGYPQAFIEKHKETQEKIDTFIEKLSAKTPLPIVKFDESFSTKEATDMLLSLGQHSKKSRSKIDKVSAAHFLQKFLDQRNQNNETIQSRQFGTEEGDGSPE